MKFIELTYYFVITTSLLYAAWALKNSIVDILSSLVIILFVDWVMYRHNAFVHKSLQAPFIEVIDDLFVLFQYFSWKCFAKLLCSANGIYGFLLRIEMLFFAVFYFILFILFLHYMIRMETFLITHKCFYNAHRASIR